MTNAQRLGSLSSHLALVLLALSLTSDVRAKPNVVFILADDLGWSDTSNSRTNLGNPSDFYETPALERLSLEGMAFTNAYTNGPNCAPTRAALLSGAYGPRPTNNVYNVGNLNRGGRKQLLVGPSQGLPSGADSIPNSAFTMAEMLQKAGYTTAHFGKFHVAERGTAESDIVRFHGFDENFGGSSSGSPGQYHAEQEVFSDKIGSALDAFAARYTQAYVDTKLKPYSRGVSESAIDALVGTEKHVSDAMVDAAVDFMERSKGDAFFVQYHPYAVHTPIGDTQARSDLLAKYQRKSPTKRASKASFGALIEELDQSVGRLINYLETTPDPRNSGDTLDKNTLVIFFSDNGGRLSQSDNGPLKGQKGELDEGGIRVPLIAWSGNKQLVRGGVINHTPVIGVDFYPTFAKLVEGDKPAGVPLDGEDLSAILADPHAKLDRDALFWHFPGYLVDKRNQRPQSVIRSGDWKLFYNYEDQSFELYDLKADIAESNNVAAEQPEVRRRLGRQLMEWLEKVNAPLATLRKGKKAIRLDGEHYTHGDIRTASETRTIVSGEELPFCLK